MIARDPRGAAATSYDMVIVGGGIQGAALALEAASRGLSTVLLEAEDFGGGTSWNSLRVVHGGLRYLQSVDLARFRESVRARREWLRDFPELVEPLPCLMPLYGRGLHRPAVLRAALAVNDLLTPSRNRGVRSDRALPAGRILSPARTLEQAPLLERDGLLGSAVWCDARMEDSQRLVIELLRWATASGAVALNYVAAEELLSGPAGVEGVAGRDAVGGETFEYRAPVVVNCAGPWCREVARRFDRDRPDLFRLSLAFNVLLDREPPSDIALAVTPPVRGGQTYFLHPWKGRLLAGTAHLPHRGPRDSGTVTAAHVGSFLAEINRALPALEAAASDVLRVTWGFLPARESGSSALAVRDVILHHADDGGPHGLFSVSGIKFTTARAVARRTLAAVQRATGVALAPVGAVERPRVAEWPAAAVFANLLARDPDGARRLVRRIAAEEAVVHLDDLLLRRTDWALLPEGAAALTSPVADWLDRDPDRRAAERSRLAARVAWLPAGLSPTEPVP